MDFVRGKFKQKSTSWILQAVSCKFCQLKPVHLALPETRPTLLENLSGGGFELNESQTNPESQEHKNK